jgi:hypothetical protein
MIDAQQWAKEEYGAVNLKDKRRTLRLVEIAAALAQTPTGVLPQAFPLWKELKAAYLFLACQRVSHQALLKPHLAKVRQACQQPGEYVLYEDKSELDYTALRATSDLGRIGDNHGRGFMLDTTLAFAVRQWARSGPVLDLLGLFDQQAWRRQDEPKKKNESTRQSSFTPARIAALGGGPGDGAAGAAGGALDLGGRS